MEKDPSKSFGFEEHYASSFSINEPIKFWINRQAIGDELDFSRLTVNENAIALSDFFARPIVVRQTGPTHFDQRTRYDAGYTTSRWSAR